jgi:plastocyanin
MSILGKRVSTKWVMTFAAIIVCVAGLLPVWTKERTRDVVLVASDMAFRLEADPSAPNPVITVSAGETVRIVLKNRDGGMMHDFAVPSIGAAMEPIKTGQEQAITFEAPATPGSYEYLCRPHTLMMKGTLRVTR